MIWKVIWLNMIKCKTPTILTLRFRCNLPRKADPHVRKDTKQLL